MSRPNKYPYCFTLRLPSAMEAALENLAYDLRLSKAGTIREVLGRAIAEANAHELADQYRQVQGGAQ